MDSEVQRAVQALREGGLIGLPTETVYGLGADASNDLAVRRIFAVKGRPSSHPLIVHVASALEAERWSSQWPASARTLAASFWPGPLTLIVRRSALASDAVTGGQDTVGLRVPSHPVALEVLRAFGGGIAAPSANRFGRVSPTTAQHVRDELGAEVDVIVDGGPSNVGVESTIVDLSGPSPRILRPGGITREAIEAALGQPVVIVSSAPDIRAPGLLEKHYAPRAGVWLVDEVGLESELRKRTQAGQRLAVLAPRGTPVPQPVVHFEVPADDEGYARELYATLRLVDAREVDVLLVVPPKAAGLGLAVVDRLRRASTRPKD